ncbi:TolC family protein [bacterium]|nr:TolC family protein [bacterium]
MTGNKLIPLLVTLALLSSAAFVPVSAQSDSSHVAVGDTLILDLYRSIAIALGESPDAYYSQESLNQSYISFRSAALDMYSPTLDSRFGVPSITQALSQELIYDAELNKNTRQWVETETRQMEGDLSLSQPLPTGGTVEITSRFYQQYYTNEYIGQIDELEYNTTYRASFTQELLRGNLRRYARQQAELSYENTLLNTMQSQRNLVFNVLESYYALLASERELEISRDDLHANRETADLAHRKFEAGLIPEVEALQLEVEASRVETNLLSAEATYEGQLDRFRSLLGIELDQPISIVGDPGFDTLQVNLDKAIEKALAKREEIRQAEISVEQAELSLKNTRRPYNPGGQLTAFYGLNQRTDTIDEAFSDDYNDYLTNRGIAFNLNIPLFSGGRRNLDVQSARLSLRRAEFDASQAEMDIILDVRAAVRSLEEARRRYEISKASLEISEKSFDISRQRFANGQITAQDWIDAQIQVNRSRISTTQALMDHNIALARYRMTVGEPVLPGVTVRSISPDPDL